MDETKKKPRTFTKLNSSLSIVCETSADVVFIINQLNTYPVDGFIEVKNIISSIVSTFNLTQVRVGILAFSNIILPLGQYTESQLATAIDKLSSVGQLAPTNAYTTFQQMRNGMFGSSGARPNNLDAAFVITNGFSSTDSAYLPSEIQKNIDSGILLFAIGVTSAVTESQVKSIVSPPQVSGANYWMAANYTDLWNYQDPISMSLCTPPKPYQQGTCVH